MTKLVVNDIEIELVKKNIKNIHLSVHPPNGRVRISAPTKMDNEAIRLFVITKLAWIKNSAQSLKNRRDSLKENSFPVRATTF